MDDPILEERLKKMFESRAGELPDESLREDTMRNARERYGRCGSGNVYMNR